MKLSYGYICRKTSSKITAFGHSPIEVVHPSFKCRCRATLIMSPCGDIRNVPFWRRYDNRNVP